MSAEKVVDKNKLIAQIKKHCQLKSAIAAVYVFGSLIQGDFQDNSDVDIAIITEEEIDKLETFDLKLELELELSKKLDLKVDVVLFSQADLRLKKQIINGRLILDKNNSLRVAKEKQARTEYLDMRYFFDQYEKNIGKGFKDGK